MKFGGGGGGMGNMLAQAQKMQSEMKAMQERLGEKEMSVDSAGGRIKIVINGKQEIKSIQISPEVIDPKDPAMLCDLVKVAVNQAVQSSQKMVSDEMSKVIPPGLAGLL